jgi:ring-1,2-phenylacetyl-CoA epoxidase subunit PaaE
VEDDFYAGRIDKNKSIELFNKYPNLLQADDFYLCGPEEMIKNVVSTIQEKGVANDKVHFELFKASEKSSSSQNDNEIENSFKGESKVRVLVDGDEIDFELNSKGDYILDAAMEQGADAPFSCKGAVCCTCKALVVEGQAIMDMNYALSDAEVEQGFVLTCVARPASEKVVVDFDVI